MEFDPRSATEVGAAHLADFRTNLEHLDRIDRWFRWDHEKPHAPRRSTTEYKQLADRAQTPWLWLVVKSLAQILIVEGYRPSTGDGPGPWQYWQANGMDKRQVAIHVDALAYGYCYTRITAGRDPVTGDPTPLIRGFSPRRMLAFFDDPADDIVPQSAIQVDRKMLEDPATKRAGWGHEVRLWGDTHSHLLHEYETGGELRYITSEPHGAGQCPIVRYQSDPDQEGRSPGEVEPFIPVAARIDQTTFDRLVVQRFSSWVVRTVSGMAEPSDKNDAEARKLQLRVEDLLIAEDHDTKFGSLPATPLDGFLKAKEADVHDLAAVSQTPPHNLLGQMVNLSAEALAAAETSHARKGGMRKLTLGDGHNMTLRLAAAIAGDTDAARDVGGSVLWRDVESRSLAQAVDALGKMAQMLGVPLEWLWSRIPGATQQDVETMKELALAGGGVDALMRDLLANTTPTGVDLGADVG